MVLQVFVQLGQFVEHRSAQVAAINTRRAVCPQVVLETANEGEGLVAEFAFVRLQVGVQQPGVLLEFVAERELALARPAGVLQVELRHVRLDVGQVLIERVLESGVDGG